MNSLQHQRLRVDHHEPFHVDAGLGLLVLIHQANLHWRDRPKNHETPLQDKKKKWIFRKRRLNPCITQVYKLGRALERVPEDEVEGESTQDRPKWPCAVFPPSRWALHDAHRAREGLWPSAFGLVWYGIIFHQRKAKDNRLAMGRETHKRRSPRVLSRRLPSPRLLVGRHERLLWSTLKTGLLH